MLHQHAKDPTLVHPTAPAEVRGDATVLALRRAQPPPTGWRTSSRRELRFWSHLAAAALLAALIPITAAAGVNIAESPAARLLVAIAIPVVAGLAVTATAAATDAVPRPSRRERRTSC